MQSILIGKMNTVKLSDAHLRVINKALETYARLKSGQIKIALDTAYDHALDWEEADGVEKRIRSLLPQYKNLSSSASYGVGSPQLGAANIAYEIKKTFEEYLAVKNNDGFYGHTVDFDGPLKVSEEPLPIIEDHKNYKDYPLNRDQSYDVLREFNMGRYKEMWKVIDSFNLKLPKAEKLEIVFGKFEGKEAIYGGCNTRVIVRAYKPRRS